MENLKKYRKEKNMSQTELSQAVGVAQSEISAYESGAKSPKLAVALAISRALGVKLGELAGE